MKHFGYREDVILDSDYRFGGATKLPTNILRSNGDWKKFLPEIEYQRKNDVETSACVTFATHNALETLFAAQYGMKVNFSERYTAKLSGTTKDGNSPQKVIEYIRKYIGTIPDTMLPFDDSIKSWDKFYSGIQFNHLLIGLQWILRWNVQHEWVDGTHEAMKDALKFSPLGCAVNAWHLENGLYTRSGSDNHWTLIIDYKDKDHWLVWDSYDKVIKKLEWNYSFTRVKRYSIQKRAGVDIKTFGRAILGTLKGI